jgi:hypothetical protein
MWEGLSQQDKNLIIAFFPSLPESVTVKTKSPAKLLKNIRSWCFRHPELLKTCSRCGGTGHFSFNQLDGTICYGCNGAKYVLKRIDKDFISTVQRLRAEIS